MWTIWFLTSVSVEQMPENYHGLNLNFTHTTLTHTRAYTHIHTCAHTTHTIHTLLLLREEHTCYDLWCWPRRYIETGMILDYGVIMPLVMSNALSLINNQSGTVYTCYVTVCSSLSLMQAAPPPSCLYVSHWLAMAFTS